MKKRSLGVFAVAVMSLAAAPALAKITKIEITKTEPAYGGATFGAAGTYERVIGVAYGEVDPKAPGDKIIQDIELAPRNARGMVEYSTDIDIVRPADPTKSNRVLLFNILNRGNKGATPLFNADMPGAVATNNNVTTAGDGWMQREGYTTIWFGWQADVLPGDGRMLFHVPVAHKPGGGTLTGVMRSELVTQKPVNTLNLASGWFTGMTHASYPAENTDNTVKLEGGFLPTLTMQMRAGGPGEVIPNSQWHFGGCDTPNNTQICLPAGFQPGRLYQLVYRARDPLVMGLGFAVARDIGAFLQHADKDSAGHANPVVHGAAVKSIVMGTSQSGRFIRSMIALGFNRGEDGKRVYDGAMPHIGGGLMPLNLRFAPAGRAWGQQVDHDFPAYDFPFTYARESDPLTGRTQGLLDRCEATKTCPRIFHAATALEIWEGRQSLGLTDPLGLRDAVEPANVRTFIMASTQHGPAALPLPAGPNFGFCQQQSNPNPHTWTMRALLAALTGWVRDDQAPPPSEKPRVADGTLVAPDRVRFPVIPATNYGVERPEPRFTGAVSTLHVLDYGPGWRAGDSSGVITKEPPVPGAASYGVLVPQVDADGIDVAGVRDVYLGAPIGTYTSWNAFRPELFDGGFCNFQGSFIPFAATRADREAAHDPRPSLEERYPTKDAYVAAVRKAADALQAKRMLLPADAERLVAEAQSKGVRSGP